ncbi:MAG: OB-fold nucleic acid binding domain-containing protein [Candidatus Omnitrophota bacterium]
MDRKTAEKIFGLIEYFAGYGFNKSHSAAYALISYRTAYLKANYPVEFMTALLTSEKDNTDKISLYINECLRMRIKVLPPDVNESFANFTVSGGSIRFGLAAVKNVGQSAIDSIITGRKEGGAFKSLYDFTERVDSRLVNRKVIESLIKCGAFDSVGLFRSQLLSIIDNALDIAGGIQKDRMNGQLSFFDTFETDDTFKKTVHDIPDIPEWSERQLLAYEKELLGFYITKHPLSSYEDMLKRYSSCKIQELSTRRDGEDALLGGIMSKVKLTTTKKTGEKMAIIGFEDLSGSCEALVFPRTYKTVGSIINVDAIVFIKGKISLREDDPKVLVNDIIPIDDVKSKYTSAIHISLTTPGLDDIQLDGLKGILVKHHGKTPVFINFVEPGGRRTRISLGKKYCVQANDALVEDIESVAGAESVHYQINM